MTQDISTYYIWIGGSCDYGHKERYGSNGKDKEGVSSEAAKEFLFKLSGTICVYFLDDGV